ncbi:MULTISPECIES: hypothetical protein [Pseudomonas]|uniref:hypothetical protein n=1 Tax=Pseudomonas TaxID=286 RepID=UPI0015F88625|nr:hypothetical protein [Pseudomonas putida]
MITEFFFDDTFFSSTCLHDINLSAVHDIFLNSWMDYGVLVHPPGYLVRYDAAINSLPVKYQVQWRAALAHCKKISTEIFGKDIVLLSDFEEALENYLGCFDTAFVEDTLAYVLCGDGSISRHCKATQFEVVGAPAVTQSENFKKSIAFSKQDIAGNANISVIWQERFKKLAKHSKRVTICDRFLFKRILDDIVRGAHPSIKNFFDFLVAESGDYYVTIFSDGGTIDSQQKIEIENYFAGLLKPAAGYSAKVKRITLISNEKEVFQEFSHDRYVRFDDYVCALGNGMAIFERNPISNTTVSIKLKAFTNVDAIEKALRDDPRWHEVI